MDKNAGINGVNVEGEKVEIKRKVCVLKYIGDLCTNVAPTKCVDACKEKGFDEGECEPQSPQCFCSNRC